MQLLLHFKVQLHFFPSSLFVLPERYKFDDRNWSRFKPYNWQVNSERWGFFQGLLVIVGVEISIKENFRFD